MTAMLRVPRLLTALLGAALLLTFPACDSGSDDDDDNGGGGGGTTGSVSVTVSGAYSESFSGSAFFTVDDDDDYFTLGLIGGTIFQVTTTQLVYFDRDGDRPATGEYAIGDDSDDFDAGYIDLENADGNFLNATSIEAESGTLTITSSSSDRLVGSFSFSGSVFSASNPSGGGTAMVEGTFTAEFIDEDDAPDVGDF